MKVAIIDISPRLLIEALHLPPETEIHEASWDFSRCCILLRVSHPDLKDVPEGYVIGRASPQLRRHFQEVVTSVEFVGWGQ